MTSQGAPPVRLIALYLPQFHPIPENDAWWGKGFTEWTNVVKARPVFRGHYQPHLPADLGFYDLRLPEIREAQAGLARAYGIYGFCYYHYWFNGKRLLNRPFDEVLLSGRPDFPFCLCWANENWTRRWDGYDNELLIRQEHSLQDDEAHIEHLLPVFQDSRYIKINGRPLFLIYRSEMLPDSAKTAELWRRAAQKAGFPDLFLVRVESFRGDIDPTKVGFDAAVEFAPDKSVVRESVWRSGRLRLLSFIRRGFGRLGINRIPAEQHRIFSYDSLAAGMVAKADVPYPRFRCITPGWDNSARRQRGATIFVNSSPKVYEAWLRTLVQNTGEERIVFINAWNEWAEGNHLEPDQRWGHGFLESTLRGSLTSTEWNGDAST
jgi:lipopolysaccharide biosynthesis protein